MHACPCSHLRFKDPNGLPQPPALVCFPQPDRPALDSCAAEFRRCRRYRWGLDDNVSDLRVLAVAATGCFVVGAPAKTTHATIAVALVGTISVLLAAMSRTPWQVDIHMYYFAALALLATLCDWEALLAATTATAIHHFVLNFVFPGLLYPGGSDFPRVVLHAVILLIEAGALIWLTVRINLLFAKSTASVAEAQAALTNVPDLQALAQADRAACCHGRPYPGFQSIDRRCDGYLRVVRRRDAQGRRVDG